jgi:hypothetical protein
MKYNPSTPPTLHRFSHVLLLALSLAAARAETDAEAAPGELLFSEDFNRSTHVNSWFVFGGGDNFTFRGDVIPFAGKDGTNAFVFSANAEAYRNYWFGAIGRGNIIKEPWTSLDKLALRFDLGSLGDEKAHRVSVRLVQGDTNKPSWSAKWVLEIGRTIKTYDLVLDSGAQTGEFNREAPITLHAITFGHMNFGSAPDVQVVIDNVMAFGRDRVPPPR